MDRNDLQDTNAQPRPRRGAANGNELPAWTSGLRQLYDTVVDEDLPDSFKDLLARLDEPNP